MTPDTISPDDMPIYKGAQWSHVISFEQNVEGYPPVDITGLGPFVVTIKRATKNVVLAQAAVEILGDPEDGQIMATLTAAQTSRLPLGQVRIGIRDAYNNPYGEGFCSVNFFTPEPA